MKKFLLGAFLVALGSLSANAQNLRSGHSDDLVQATDDLRDAVNNPYETNEQISGRTFHFSNVGLPSTKIGIGIKLHPWAEYDAPENKNATIATIIKEGEKALMDAKSNPPTEVTDAAVRGAEMSRDLKLDFGTLESNQAGVYNYKDTSKELGTIQLNEFFKVMARIVPPKLLYATIIHESTHANDHQAGKLTAAEVKKGEISAFHAEWAYLETISTSGQEIAMAWTRLDSLAKNTHNPIAARAADYVFSLLALYRTKGDDRRILEYVDKMGYQEGAGRVKTSPFSS